MLLYGIEQREVQGVTVRITSPARTVVDGFRYRNKIGIDVALRRFRSRASVHGGQAPEHGLPAHTSALCGGALPVPNRRLAASRPLRADR
jgi:hypothetical protein